MGGLVLGRTSIPRSGTKREIPLTQGKFICRGSKAKFRAGHQSIQSRKVWYEDLDGK